MQILEWFKIFPHNILSTCANLTKLFYILVIIFYILVIIFGSLVLSPTFSDFRSKTERAFLLIENLIKTVLQYYIDIKVLNIHKIFCLATEDFSIIFLAF